MFKFNQFKCIDLNVDLKFFIAVERKMERSFLNDTVYL